VISGREDLDAQMAALMADDSIEIARPEHWGGYEIVLDGMEFWQGRPGRVHDRARYQKVDGAWVKTRLSP
jgi:pyridoxamine 5'-phosphate oxidase